MPPGRKIPRSPSPPPRRPEPPADDTQAHPDATKAAGDLTTLEAQIRSCEACGRRGTHRALGTGPPRAPVMVVKERPSARDLETGNALTIEAPALTKAFEALGIPSSWVYGTTAVRCGDAPATSEEVATCSAHLLIEIEAVGPSVLIACGPRVTDAIRALDGRCGFRVPDDIAPAQPVPIRSDVVVLVTEPLPEGVRDKEAKRRLWRDLQALPSLLGA